MDGEELVGAKQDRVLNLSILVPAQTTVKIPVSCVEQGRWHHVSPRFEAAPRAHYARGRARRQAEVSQALKFSAGMNRMANQGTVWADPADRASELGARSETMAMEDVFRAHETTVDSYVRSLSPVNGQRGGSFRRKWCFAGA